jgi:hypothetical protein
MEEVAVGLPHRNYSVFKQTHINQWEVKVVEVRTRASEAKGPFPGGKRVGSWGKKRESKIKEKAHGLRSMGLLFLNDTR